MDFPAQPWAPVSDLPTRDRDRLLADLPDRIRRQFAAPRDLDQVRTFLRRSLPPGSFAVYGAGSHSDALLETLSDLPGSRLCGFLDQRAAALGEYGGYPVVAPEDWRSLGAERILLSHSCREADMAERLHSLGVPADRVMPIYLNPDFRAVSVAAGIQQLDAALWPGRDTLIIRAGRSQIIEDEHLARVLSPDRSLCVSICRADYLVPGSCFPHLDLRQSLDLLDHLIGLMQPRLIFLSTGWFNNFLFPTVRAMAPQARLIHEVFDWCLLFPDAVMTRTIGHEDATLRDNLLGEFASAKGADLVISKRAGELWQRVEAGFDAPYLCFYPGARPALTRTVSRGAPVHLVYGGVLPLPDFLATHIYDYDFLPLFEDLAEGGKVEIDIYNTLHVSPRDDARFAAYSDRYNQKSLRYHASLTYAAFLQAIRDADYGWLATVNRVRTHHDQLCVMPHRAVGYLSAGLPLLVDAGWQHVAGLVKRYDAGRVLEDFSPESLNKLLPGLDRAAHRAGAARLAQYLVAHNATALDAIEKQLRL